MDSSIPKQFMKLGGHPLVCYSLWTFEQSRVDEIILVTGRDEADYCRTQIVEKYRFSKVSKIIVGGSERYLSVYQGLLAVERTDIVLIHDGARPFVADEIIESTIQSAVQYGTGIAAVPAKDTVKIADDRQFAVETPARESVWMMQTPQTFQYPLIRTAYEAAIAQHIENLTDDAMAVESTLDTPVKLVRGSYRNLKVTTPEDMDIAEALLKNCAHDLKVIPQYETV